MNFTAQDYIAIALVSAAAVYVVCRLFRIGPWKKRSQCGHCDCSCDESRKK